MAEIDTAAHTPGPWIVRQFPTGANARGTLWVTDAIPDQDGKVVANAVCSVAMTNDDATANAELIASAPSLLAESQRLRTENARLRALLTKGDSNVEDDA